MPRLRDVLPCALLALPATASAWTEAEPIEAELRASIDSAGTLVGLYRVTISIDAGRFHGFDLDGLPEGFTPDPLASSAHDAQGVPLGVRFEAWRSGRIHVAIDGAHGEGRGRVVFDVAFTARADVSEVDGEAVVAVSTPPWDHGMNRTLVTLDLPVGASEVQVIEPDLFDSLDVREVAGRAEIVALRYRVPRWTPMSLAVRLPRARCRLADRSAHRRTRARNGGDRPVRGCLRRRRAGRRISRPSSWRPERICRSS